MKYLFIVAPLAFGLLLSAQRTPRQGRSPGQIPSGATGPNVLVDFHGTLSMLTSKKLILTLEESKKGEENTMEIFFSRKTVALDGDKKLKLTDLKTGQMVDVEAKQQIDGSMEAVKIHLDH
jgi:hypothetical protein